MAVFGFVFITGTASGIGRACANAFAQEDSAGIALLDLNAEALALAKAEIEEQASKKQENGATRTGNIQLLTYSVNIGDEAQVTQAVNAAGIAIKHHGGAAFAKTEDWKRVLVVNINGTFYVLRAAAQIMLKQDPMLSTANGRPLQRGSIVNFGSTQGMVGITLSTAYTTTKHAVIGLTRTAAEDYVKGGLCINVICPGYTETPMATNPPGVEGYGRDGSKRSVYSGWATRRGLQLDPQRERED